ncbi:late expression factor 8 [Orgyia leucostigma nucleopolyhedrovirus]|uniref:Late expression factor 8 n=1 Tax=Orgyia leucostigma nucleopolyhedrovirus TaxID=490711 RepID=B0FDR3_9ABAC|nr:late expression factor 8 [Orgyia leucostigma nucleopolyhedrovirus]ABY65771.1 late expression factor 8 [Orgyia leucostigma nucleopolyhedrovirus]
MIVVVASVPIVATAFSQKHLKMTDVVKDFDALYLDLEKNHNLQFYLNCFDKQQNTITYACLQERKSYLCCAVDAAGGCVLHKCVPVIFGTALDSRFRSHDVDDYNTDIRGTFMIDGRHLSFPNIMMNNNILVHNFYDKLYSKSCKRMFLYGNVDEEKKINRAIQLVYDKHDDVLFARDVYARDYVVTKDLNNVLHMYLQKSGKWEPLNFLFEYESFQSDTLVDQIKAIMRVNINYSIDSLANKIIYKHDYLLTLTFRPILKMFETAMEQQNVVERVRDTTNGSDAGGGANKKRKLQTVLYPRESKKIVETIVNGKLIYTVSKTFSKQRKNFINYQDNSSNNNIEICPPLLKYRIGNEVVRITNDTMRQDMLMQKSDFVKFVDSFFHGEMTVAGKKFFLCRNVRLPPVDYDAIKTKFNCLIETGLIRRVCNADEANTTQDSPILHVAFNDRPTVFCCRRTDLRKIFYEFKRNACAVELKLANDILFVNHHEGMVCIKRTVLMKNSNVKIVVLLTPYEYHNDASILNTLDDVGVILEHDDVTCLMSKLVQYYYKNFTNIFYTVPVPKLIVSLTNLKNAMPVLVYDDNESTFLNKLPQGNSVVVAPRIRLNNKMFNLWTLVRDHRLMTAEDPYIPDENLPIILYNNKINKLKGKLVYSKHEMPVVKFNANNNKHNCVMVDGGMMLHMAGVVVSNVKVGWIYDGKRYKIESCKNKNHFVSKIYVYFRRLRNQTISKIESTLNVFNDTVYLKLNMVTRADDLRGIKICGIHGQKGVMNGSEDLTEWMAEDGTHAQICLSPISYLSRQSNFEGVEKKYVVRGGDFADPDAPRYPIYNIPYMFFNNTPDNIFKEFLKINHTGHEKAEGTRLDQWTINQSFAGNRLSESLQCIRGSSNLPDDSGEFNIMSSLLHCNNTIVH